MPGEQVKKTATAYNKMALSAYLLRDNISKGIKGQPRDRRPPTFEESSDASNPDRSDEEFAWPLRGHEAMLYQDWLELNGPNYKIKFIMFGSAGLTMIVAKKQKVDLMESQRCLDIMREELEKVKSFTTG